MIAYDSFLGNPCEINTKNLLEAIPDKLQSSSRSENEWGKTLNHLFDQDRFSRLVEMLSSGNPNAFDVAFKIRILSDGHSAEMIDIALGNTITQQAVLFLDSLQSNAKYVPRLDSLLGNLGPVFVDKPVEQLSEITSRYNAILAVNRVDLLPIKTKCLNVLSSRIIRTKEWIREVK